MTDRERVSDYLLSCLCYVPDVRHMPFQCPNGHGNVSATLLRNHYLKPAEGDTLFTDDDPIVHYTQRGKNHGD